MLFAILLQNTRVRGARLGTEVMNLVFCVWGLTCTHRNANHGLSKMALAAKTARLALGRTIIDAQYLADRVLFMNSKYEINSCKISLHFNLELVLY